MKISAIIPALNEEKNIKDCILSLAPIADEILVGDSGSTDKTEITALESGAAVVKLEWKGFVATRNELQKIAKHEWVLFLDADERLSETLIDSIKSIKNKDFLCAYSFKRLNHYGNKKILYGGWYPDTKTRLFPKEIAFWQGENVHETVNTGGLKTIRLKGDIIHYSYNNAKEHLEKARKYASLAAKNKANNSKIVNIAGSIFSSSIRFIKMYFLKLGFLDGKEGLQIAAITAYEVFLKYYLATRQQKP